MADSSDFIYQDNSRVAELERELAENKAEIDKLKLLLRQKDAQISAESIDHRPDNERLDLIEHQIIQLTEVIVRHMAS